MKRLSLAQQTILGVLLAELLCAALLSGITLAHEINGRRRAFDVMLRGRADSVLGAIRDSELPDDSAVVDPSELQLPKQDVYIVLDPSDHVLGESPGLSSELRQHLRAPSGSNYFYATYGKAEYRAVRRQGVRVIDRDDTGGIRRPVLIVYASPTRYLWHEAVEGVQFDLVAGFLLLAITGFALAWFLRRRLAPLEELAAIAGRVSPKSWDFVPPSEILNTRELAPIAHSIAQLLESLRSAFERQRQLTGDAAHELKTSIAVLKSSLQLLILKPRTAEEYVQGLDGLLIDTERTEDLATRMLALARLEETAAEDSDSGDLQIATRNTVQRLARLAESRQVEMTVVGDSSLPVPISQEDAEVLASNLIMNALQHTAAGGRVVITLVCAKDHAELRVADNGEGIPETALPHVFERFYRADRSRSRRSGGAGLGLSICKAMIDRAHGSIEVRSKPGKGTEVCVRIPSTVGHRQSISEVSAEAITAH